MTAAKDKRISYEDMYDRLLDVTEEFSLQGANPFHVANVMSRFVVELSFDCAPNDAEATHLLLDAITARIERDREDAECNTVS
tara:strand:- start:414 stop:662 length:249 start_codon:yes stop_codon:yes gene_type:complete